MSSLKLLLSATALLGALACDYQACRQDALDHEDDFVRCDMCNCEGIDDLSGDDGTCSTDNNDLFNCYIKFDQEDLTWTCALRMKIGYILLFVFISIFGCCACVYCCSLGGKRYQSSANQGNNNLQSNLINNNYQQSHQQPGVVIVQSSTPQNQEIPVVVTQPAVSSTPVKY